MRKAAILFIGAIAAMASAAQAHAQTADAIAQKYLQALGGRAALEKLQTRVQTGTISLTTQGMTFSGPIEAYNKVPNKSRMFFRLDVSTAGVGAAEMVVDQRCDGTTAFTANNVQGDRELSGEELQDKLNAVFPSPLLGYKEAGAKIELAGKDKVGERDVYVLLFTPKAGVPSRLHFDAETYLLLRTVSTIQATAGGTVERIYDLRDYKDVGGIKVPFGLKISMGPQTIDITMTKIEHNKPIDDAMFVKPAK